MAASAGDLQEALIPGLPDHVALRCLALVNRNEHARLRCVSTRWRSLFRRGLSSLHAVRRSMYLTQSYLVLFPREFHRDVGGILSYYEIHVHPSTFTSTVTARSLHVPLRADELPSLRGHACISIGPMVLLVGGSHTGPKPLSSLHIFDTTSSTWWHGANMQFPRSNFGWGVIDNRLYVAGGFVDEVVGHIPRAEVYDIEADQWSRLPDLPLTLLIDMSFVYKGAFYVRGCEWECIRLRKGYALKLFSYNPLLKEWKEEDCMLGSVFKDVKPLTTNKIITLQEKEDDTLYMLDVKEEVCIMYDLLPARVKVLKLAPDALEWETEYEVLDVTQISLECPCSEKIYRDVSFPSIGNKVIAIDHVDLCGFFDDDEMDLQRTHCNEVLRLSLSCPLRWDVVTVNV